MTQNGAIKVRVYPRDGLRPVIEAYRYGERIHQDSFDPHSAFHRKIFAQAIAGRVAGQPAEIIDEVEALVIEANNAAALEALEKMGAGKPVKYRVITSAEFAATKYQTDYLIKNVLVAGQPCMVAGAQKTLKTSFAVALAVSLASGRPFLGKFAVSRPARTLIMSGESGLGTLQETAVRICKAEGLELADLDELRWSEDTPLFGQDAHLLAIRATIEEHGVEVLVIDPLYMCIPGADAGNLMIMGGYLRGVAEVCRDTGTTLILLHHTKKNRIGSDPYAPPELHDLSWAGMQEFARQWLLIGRREKYEPGTGLHRLWLSIGGSAGHSSLWGVDVDEGVRTETTDRHWDVGLVTAEEARQQAKERNQTTKERDKQAKYAADVADAKERILRAFNSLPGHQGVISQLRDASGRKGKAFDEAFGELVRTGQVKPCKVQRANKQWYDGYQRIYPKGEQPDAPESDPEEENITIPIEDFEEEEFI